MMLFGFGFVAQLRSHEKITERLETESEADLVEIIDRLDGEIRLTRQELTDQQLKMSEYQQAEGDTNSLIDRAGRQILELEMFVGEKPAGGPGIVIAIQDREHLLTGFDIRQVIEELRSSGAWAMAVNGRRIDSRSSLWRRSGFIYIDGQKIVGAINIEAIGPQAQLFQAITLPRGIRDKISTLSGVSVSVKKKNRLKLAAIKKVKLSSPSGTGAKPVKQGLLPVRFPAANLLSVAHLQAGSISVFQVRPVYDDHP